MRKRPREIRIAGLLLALSWALGGCAEMFEPRLPSLEAYLPRVSGRSPGPEDSPRPPEAAVPGGQPAAGALTLEACTRVALGENPMLQASREGVAAAREAAGEAWASYYPQVGLTAGYRRWRTHAFLPAGLGGTLGATPDTVGPTNDWNGGLGASLTLFDSGRRRAEVRAAKAELGASREESAAAEQDIVLDVHQTFYSVLAAGEALRVARGNLARAEGPSPPGQGALGGWGSRQG